jgi:anti-sigma factor RsiW
VTHPSRPSRCRLDELPDYVSGKLSAQRTLDWDRHLISCGSCQHAVAGERRLQSLLASGCPSMPGSLHAQLVALASSMPGPSVTRTSEHAPLEMVAPSAPPAHRSPLRSAALATAAASATAAVAWTLTIAGPGAISTTVTSVGGASPAVRPAVGSTSSSSGTRVRTVSTAWTSGTSVRNLVICEAESRT